MSSNTLRAQLRRAIQLVGAQRVGDSGDSGRLLGTGAVDDIRRVFYATGLEHPTTVGWSYGATIVVRDATRH